MKIKTRIVISILLSLILASGISILLGYTFVKMDEMGALEDAATSIVRGGFELSYLTSDYLINGEERAQDQWKSKYNTLQNDISFLYGTDPKESTAIDSIQEYNEKVKAAYNSIPENLVIQNETAHIYHNFHQILWARNIVQIQGLIYEASHLQQLYRDKLNEIQFYNGVLIFILILSILVILSVNYLLINHSLVISIGTLIKGTNAFASGDLDYSIQTGSDDEINEIALALNNMATRLKNVTASRDDLNNEIEERKRAEHQILLYALRNKELINLHNIEKSVSDEEIMQYTLEAGIRSTESRYGFFGMLSEDESDMTIYTWSQDAMTACSIHNTPIHFPISQAGIWGECVRTRSPFIMNEYHEYHPLKKGCPDGHVPITRFLGVPIIHESHIVLVVGVANKEGDYNEEDVSAIITLYQKMWEIFIRRRYEQERNILLFDLEQKNKEMERFVYTVSHDLKSPIITIKGFLGYLERDAISGNIERFHGDISRIRNAADKMQHLLEDLLELSRIGRMKNPSVDIRFTDLAKEAAEMSLGILEKSGAVLQISPDMPVVHGDKTRLLQVLTNLIENAAKFTSNTSEPKVEIGAVQTNDITAFYVKDNGIGVDPEFHERVFELFDKLNPDTPGTGVGLTLVKRIIEEHGGIIWVKSDGLNSGTTFFFTLPIVDMDRQQTYGN